MKKSRLCPSQNPKKQFRHIPPRDTTHTSNYSLQIGWTTLGNEIIIHFFKSIPIISVVILLTIR